MLLSVVALLCGCQFSDDEYDKPEPVRSLEADVEALKKYMTIDTVANKYSVVITEEQRLQEGISKEHLMLLLSDIDEMNRNIEQDIKIGNVVTLYLARKDFFKAYTIDPGHRLGDLGFKDVWVPEKKARTRAGSLLGWAHFINGNWEKGYRTSFEGSDHVTSILEVGNSKGRWQVSFVCNTGKSSYGTEFHTYGNGSSHGAINRYWWWTNGGDAPYKWNFTLGGPPGGDAAGSLSFRNTQ